MLKKIKILLIITILFSIISCWEKEKIINWEWYKMKSKWAEVINKWANSSSMSNIEPTKAILNFDNIK